MIRKTLAATLLLFVITSCRNVAPADSPQGDGESENSGGEDGALGEETYGDSDTDHTSPDEGEGDGDGEISTDLEDDAEWYEPCHRVHWTEDDSTPGNGLIELTPGKNATDLTREIGQMVKDSEGNPHCLPLISSQIARLNYQASKQLETLCLINQAWEMTCHPDVLEAGVIHTGKIFVSGDEFGFPDPLQPQFVLNIQLQNI